MTLLWANGVRLQEAHQLVAVQRAGQPWYSLMAPPWGSPRTSSHVGQYRRVGRAEMSLMKRLHLPHLLRGLPAEAG